MNLNRVFRVLLTVLVFICAAMPGTALGQVHDHEEGFFLRLSAGGGGASTEVTENGVTLKCSGPAGDVNFAIGGIVSPNLALHGTIFGWTITDPEVKVSNLSGNLEGELTLSGIGAGLTYYFMPANLYISGTLGVGRLGLPVAHPLGVGLAALIVGVRIVVLAVPADVEVGPAAVARLGPADRAAPLPHLSAAVTRRHGPIPLPAPRFV